MKQVIFRGCGSAIPTPFNEEGINYKALKELVEYQIDNKVDSIIVCGTTGEASTMSEAEKKSVIKFVTNIVDKRIPVIAGTGSNNTIEAIKMTKYAEAVGCDGVLIVTPYYNKTSQKGLIEHYKQIASNTKLPIIIYNVPSRTGLNILPNTCKELSKIDNIVAIKEASGNISQVANICSLCGDDLLVYSGNDDCIIPILSIGGIGCISVLSNIKPKLVHDMIYDFFNGRISEAAHKQILSIEMCNLLFCDVNPIPVKACLNLMGFDYGVPRLPLIKLDDDKTIKFKQFLD